jgi:hypothetical protein
MELGWPSLARWLARAVDSDVVAVVGAAGGCFEVVLPQPAQSDSL